MRATSAAKASNGTIRFISSVEIPTDITRREIYPVFLIALRCARICQSCRGICLFACVFDGFPRQDAMSHILVIDDEPSVCRVIEAVLTAAGYTVTTATDGHAGIEAAEKQDFSVAIVDLCMPNLNGIDTIREFRAMAPHMKLIAMSGLMSSSGGNTAPDFLGMAINLAGIPKLSKPFRRIELLDVVEHVMHKKASDAA